MNLDKFINKICNSLTKSSSHWEFSDDGFYIVNKHTGLKIWIANSKYGISFASLGYLYSEYEKALRNIGSVDCCNFTKLPDKYKDKLYQAYKEYLNYRTKKLGKTTKLPILHDLEKSNPKKFLQLKQEEIIIKAKG